MKGKTKIKVESLLNKIVKNWFEGNNTILVGDIGSKPQTYIS